MDLLNKINVSEVEEKLLNRYYLSYCPFEFFESCESSEEICPIARRADLAGAAKNIFFSDNPQYSDLLLDLKQRFNQCNLVQEYYNEPLVELLVRRPEISPILPARCLRPEASPEAIRYFITLLKGPAVAQQVINEIRQRAFLDLPTRELDINAPLHRYEKTLQLLERLSEVPIKISDNEFNIKLIPVRVLEKVV